MTIQWYPGHMAKARREMQERLKAVDLVIEMRDARIPWSSGNPDVQRMLGRKPAVLVLNKADLADPVVTKRWGKSFSDHYLAVVDLNSKTGAGVDRIRAVARQHSAALKERLSAKGRLLRAVRMMVIGVPNVGKSTLINQLAGKRSARTGNTPGITRGQQWISVAESLLLLDTPGLLWPKFSDESVGVKLSACSSISDSVVDLLKVSMWLLQYLSEHYPDDLLSYSGVTSIPDDPVALMEAIGRAKGCLVSGGRVDYDRTVARILKDFRSGVIGRISLEDVAETEDDRGDLGSTGAPGE